MFEPGQKVVCIDGKFTDAQKRFLGELPVENHTYTVRDIVPGAQWSGGETVAVYLCEILGVLNDHGIERGWDCRRFRELDTLTRRNTIKNINRELVPV